MALSVEQRRGWNENGYFVLHRFADNDLVDEMAERVASIARSVAAGDERPDLIIQNEAVLREARAPEDRLSKIFRLMRTERVFRRLATDPALLELLGDLLGGDIDCFLSQFIFKHPGALGQPWHQDNYYFRMSPTPQVGVWLACSEATVENGPLWVVPGSHKEPIHDVVSDPREGANPGYVEIVDADTRNAEVVLMQPGDVLIFHSHLRHKSTDNASGRSRAAMVYHYADAATEGYRGFNHDWTEVLRAGNAVEASWEPQAIS